MKLTKKLLIGIAALFLILVVTNPSVTAFKSYLGRNSYSRLIRKNNYFVYSIYIDSSINETGMHGERYVGFLGNFWNVSPKIIIANRPIIIDSLSETDTSKLRSFYDAIKTNQNIKGIPDDYDVFKSTMKDENKAKQLFFALSKSKYIKGMPKSYNEFYEKLGLNNIN